MFQTNYHHAGARCPGGRNFSNGMEIAYVKKEGSGAAVRTSAEKGNSNEAAARDWELQAALDRIESSRRFHEALNEMYRKRHERICKQGY